MTRLLVPPESDSSRGAMLSRVADALFWMSRYLERAEQSARLLDGAFHLDLDLAGVVGGGYDLQWAAVMATLQQPAGFADRYPGVPVPRALMRWLSTDGENPNGIPACVARARANARGVRGSLPNEVWKSLNTLYWQLRDGEFIARAADSPSDYYAAVEAGSQAVQGACDALMARDEGWHFIQLGKYLERADVTTRAVDVHHELLRGLTEEADDPLAHLHWAGALRGCGAYHPYQRQHVGRVDPPRVVGFLLTDPAVPRSTQFCLDAAARALAEIRGEGSRHGETRAERLIGRARSDLRYADLSSLIGTPRLHEFLGDLLQRFGEASFAVQEEYAG
jgi:uncharacterized alpha-E superfamily protein